MRAVVLLALLGISTPAHARKERDSRHDARAEDGRTKGSKHAPPVAAAEEGGDIDGTASPEDGLAPRLGDSSRSLFDFIAAPPAEQARIVEDSTELIEARDSQESVIGRHAAEPGPPLTFYTNPTKALAVDPLHLNAIDPREFDIPIVVNDDVVRWMNYFLGPGRKYYARWLARSTAYRPMMEERLVAAKLPKDLVYLSMIESGYSTHAYSRAAAVGLWQFMSYTGRDYGLRIDSWTDERRDPVRATEAAIAFLGDLHARFDDWWLAWAAYNGGPGRVSKAIAANGTKDFWTIAKGSSLHPETENYVPKLIAAAIIGKHPERYGFVDIAYESPVLTDPVVVEGPATLDVLAKCAGVDVETLQTLNPHLRQAAVPDGAGGVRIYMPHGKGEAFALAYATLPPEERVSFQKHRVARGETLGKIAARYGVSTGDLAEMNHIKNPNHIAVGAVLVVPVGGSKGTALVSTAGSAPARQAVASAANAAPAKSAPTADKPAPAPARPSVHVVRAGDTLSGIAARYGTTTTALKQANGLRDADTIRIGQKLSLAATAATAKAAEAPAPSFKQVTVRRGDTLGALAARYKCSVSDLRSWNGLRGSTIYAGQTLKVREG